MIFDLNALNEQQQDLVTTAIGRTEFDFTRLVKAPQRATGRTTIKVEFGGADASGLKDDQDTLGLAWPEEGRVLVNAAAAEKNPLLGQAIFIHEVAHLVDELMLGATDRERIIDAVWDGEGERPGWFEGPYAQQVGELFMHLFALAFTDLESPDAFEIEVTEEAVDVVREVLDEKHVGRRRTEHAHKVRSARGKDAA